MTARFSKITRLPEKPNSRLDFDDFGLCFNLRCQRDFQGEQIGLRFLRRHTPHCLDVPDWLDYFCFASSAIRRMAERLSVPPVLAAVLQDELEHLLGPLRLHNDDGG